MQNNEQKKIHTSKQRKERKTQRGKLLTESDNTECYCAVYSIPEASGGDVCGIDYKNPYENCPR